MNKNKSSVLAVLVQNKKYLNEKFGVVDIALFGSFARGEETGNNDIDFLVEMSAPTFSKLART